MFNYLADLADAKPTAADYATTVRKLHDVLVEESGDAQAVREFLVLFHTSAPYHRGRISKRHRELVVKLLPKPPRQKPGRPEGALGDNAYKKRHQLYMDWRHDKTLNPSLTKEQFAKKRLGITDEDLKKDSEYHRYRMNALLQKLKPARMKQLDEGQRRALDVIYPLVITWDWEMARQWREAKQHSPALTKEDFLQDFIFKWPRDRKRLPLEDKIIGEYLKRLDQGEKLLIDSERG